MDDIKLIKGEGNVDLSEILNEQLPNRYTALESDSYFYATHVYDNYSREYVSKARLCGGIMAHKFVNIGFHFDKIVCAHCGKSQEIGDII